MTNEEKKQFIINAHNLYTKHQPYNDVSTIEEAKVKEDALWDEYNNHLYSYLPKVLFKYRKPTEEAIANFENDEAWFSRPADFDDTIDSVINNDIEKELEDFKNNPEEVTKKLANAFVHAFADRIGVPVNDKDINDIFPLFKGDGTFNEEEARKYLATKMSLPAANECVKQLREKTNKVVNDKVQESIRGFLLNFIDINKGLKENTLVFSLAEEGDNQAMWGNYADGSRGFCIEYEFTADTFLGQRMLINLFPIYYGDKPFISFIDVMIKGIYSAKQINGISYDDYREWFLSAYTKVPSYSYQNEWRITFSKIMGSNLQKFPFAKSIILGERMKEEDKNRLINSARKKGITIYSRTLSASGSNIRLVKL